MKADQQHTHWQYSMEPTHLVEWMLLLSRHIGQSGVDGHVWWTQQWICILAARHAWSHAQPCQQEGMQLANVSMQICLPVLEAHRMVRALNVASVIASTVAGRVLD